MREMRPRERLSALGAEFLADAELVALLLRTGARGLDAVDVAQGLLVGCGGLRGLARTPQSQITRRPGIGPGKAASLLAALEIARRLASRRLEVGAPIRSPEDVHRHFYPRLRDTLQECFITLLLDGRHRVLREVVISRGTLTASLVHPREVFRPAVHDAAAALVLVHNHPSGDPAPSLEDREVTARLVRSGELLGVQIVDHVIVAERGYHSFRESGDLASPEPGRRDPLIEPRGEAAGSPG